MPAKKSFALVVLAVLAAFLWLKGAQIRPFSPERASQNSFPGAQLDRPLAPAPMHASPSPTTAIGPKPTAEDLRKIALITEILRTHGDNDPRMDSDLRDLSDAAKAVIEEQYRTLPLEQRNERGTLVFLLGRNIRSEDDIRFMGSVLGEQPCRSLADCNKDFREGASGEEMHLESGTEVTLAYPQIVALKALEKILTEDHANPVLKAQAAQKIEDARRSPVPKVASIAEEMGRKLN